MVEKFSRVATNNIHKEQTPNVTYGSERGKIDVKTKPTSKFRKRLRYKTNHTCSFCFKLMISVFYLNLFLNLLVAF